MILIFIDGDLVIGDLDLFQPQALRQIRRNEARDLQSLQIIQSGGKRTKIQEWKQKRAHTKARHHTLSDGGTHHVAIVTELTVLSRLNRAAAALVDSAHSRFQRNLAAQSKVSWLQLAFAWRNYSTASGHGCVSIAK